MTNEEKLKEIADLPVSEEDAETGLYYYNICKKAFNLGLEVAAEEAEVIWVENPKLSDPYHTTATLNKKSILQHKL